jgi:hypothetical protein
MIYENIRELSKAIDDVIANYLSINYPITDTENQHSLMVFMLVRKGYTLKAVSPTKLIKSTQISVDDIFCVDEHLQQLDELCRNSIRNSQRYALSCDQQAA